MRNKRTAMVLAGLLAAAAMASPGLPPLAMSEPSEPRKPKPNDGRLPHQGAREIARRKRQMERNAQRRKVIESK